MNIPSWFAGLAAQAPLAIGLVCMAAIPAVYLEITVRSLLALRQPKAASPAVQSTAVSAPAKVA